MTMLSLTSSHSSFTLSIPTHSSSYSSSNFGDSSFSTILIPFPNPKPSPISPKLSRKGNWVSLRNKFRANSADPERGDQSQFSRENLAVSKDNNDTGPPTSLLSVLCPLLRLFSGGDPSQERNYNLEVATSSLSTLARLPWGSRSLADSLDSQEINTIDPLMRLQLYEFEACPFCRRVREAMTELDLSVEIYPCPKGSVRHREMVRRLGGKEQFPFLVDPNTGISKYESSEIVKYLFQQYGKGRNPTFGLLESTLFTGWMPTILRAGRGMTFWEKARVDPPPKKLELFSFENNPKRRHEFLSEEFWEKFSNRQVCHEQTVNYSISQLRYARIVREALCELELPYILQNVGDGSLRSKLLLESSGSNEVPYIIDPNTNTQIGDYKNILSYLFQTYSIDAV